MSQNKIEDDGIVIIHLTKGSTRRVNTHKGFNTPVFTSGHLIVNPSQDKIGRVIGTDCQNPYTMLCKEDSGKYFPIQYNDRDQWQVQSQ